MGFRNGIPKSPIVLVAVILLLLPSFLGAEDEEDRKDQLRYLIMDIHQAASYQDLKTLERLLPPVFKYSFGGDDTREGAIKFYKEYPEKLRDLATVLEAGCKKQGEYHYACPPQDADRDIIYFGPRAQFEYNPKTRKWVILWFVEGD